MDLQLKGHRAIVTGSSAGIGEAIARTLAAEGAAVIVHGRRAHAVSAVAQAISADGGQAEGLTADLADPSDCAWLISRALAAVEKESALADIKRDVSKLCGRFPLYAARLATYDRVLSVVRGGTA